ncbi:MAG: CapA family protein [Oscillospiraceae bacterium]|nr:CapA family protein [Oscillospiraceae bacterium]
MNKIFGSRASGNKNYSDKPHALTRKQRVQAQTRKLKKPGWVIVAAMSAILLLLSCVISFFTPNAYLPDTSNNKNGITMDFVGDVMLGRNIKKLGDAFGYDKLFSNMTGFWKNADLVFANLESAVLKKDVSSYNEADRDIHLWTDYNALKAASKSGINVFSCSNNHILDYGKKALTELMDYFNKHKIVYSGIGKTISEAASYEIIECGGAKIAFISISEAYYKKDIATESRSGILTLAYTDYNMLVYDASRQADVTIVYIHWGEENGTHASKDQVSIGQQLIDAGADIVIGSHPHVVQEVEKYGKGIIFYSLGNFIFDQGNTFACDSVMVEYSANREGKGAFYLYPVRINGGIPSVTTNWFYKARINHKLSLGLEKDSYYTDENGFIVIPFDISLSDEGSVTNET